MIHRKRILQQSGMFIKQNPGEAHLTIDELREMAASDNSTLLMSKVSRYIGNIAADMHWPELHALFGANTGNATSETALKGFLAQKLKNENDCSDTTELDQDIEAGEKAADTLQGWRANCDTLVVIDHYACVEYLTKYAAKGEPRSPILKQAFNSIGQNFDSNTGSHRVIKKVVMKSLGERDYAAQKTMHHLLSLKLHSSSFTVMPVSLKGSRRVRDTASIDEGASCTDYSLLDVYANREQYDSINRGEQPKKCAWGDQEPTAEVLVNCWHEFLQSPYGQSNVLDWFDKLQTVIQSQEAEDEDYLTDRCQRVVLENVASEWSPVTSGQDLNNLDVWSVKNSPQFNSSKCEILTVTRKKNPSTFPYNLAGNDLVRCDEVRDLGITITYNLKWDSHVTRIRSTANKCLGLLKRTCYDLPDTRARRALYLSLVKSQLSKCVVTATTGKAAYNIRGVMVHSVLKLPIGSRGNKDLTGQSLCRLQESVNNIGYIISDEYSMLGQVTFGWIDKRCKQATGYNDKVFGGRSLILTGDPSQLPPVADKPLYHAKPSNAVGEQGHQAYHMFDKVLKLTSSVGLCNGATGTVVDIIYQNNHQPPDLPIAVIVEFENYRGPVFNENQPLCIPIIPITLTSQTRLGFHERQQLPLRLAWALTIHKSQELTLPKAWIDIGKSEGTAGDSYVAISKVKSLASCVMEPMTYERLTSLK
ncbi:ATP-dependent DNA helicase PIF1 [Paramuricea clavata]|uniref:ATP-dependent DNA helicase n=1 Tax=Paramuricea clavata TaxID=317549 RepID=A0A6S7GC27_PARCT|nr:ATP-dependent DNA helicase PIF1 [Paramuricea clavata]